MRRFLRCGVEPCYKHVGSLALVDINLRLCNCNTDSSRRANPQDPPKLSASFKLQGSMIRSMCLKARLLCWLLIVVARVVDRGAQQNSAIENAFCLPLQCSGSSSIHLSIAVASPILPARHPHPGSVRPGVVEVRLGVQHHFPPDTFNPASESHLLPCLQPEV